MRCCLGLQRLRGNRIPTHGARPPDNQATPHASNGQQHERTYIQTQHHRRLLILHEDTQDASSKISFSIREYDEYRENHTFDRTTTHSLNISHACCQYHISSSTSPRHPSSIDLPRSSGRQLPLRGDKRQHQRQALLLPRIRNRHRQRRRLLLHRRRHSYPNRASSTIHLSPRGLDKCPVVSLDE